MKRYKVILTGNRCKVVPTYSKYEYIGKGSTIEQALANARNQAKKEHFIIEKGTASIYQRHWFKWVKIADLEV